MLKYIITNTTLNKACQFSFGVLKLLSKYEFTSSKGDEWKVNLLIKVSKRAKTSINTAYNRTTTFLPLLFVRCCATSSTKWGRIGPKDSNS